MGRKSEESPMSFFSFQDIIACTTGVMVLLTLTLVLELMNRTMKATSKAESQSAVSLKDEIKKAEKQREELKKQVAAGQRAIKAIPHDRDVTEEDIRRMEIKVKSLQKDKVKVDVKFSLASRGLDDTTKQLDMSEKEVEELKEKVGPLEAKITKLRRQSLVPVVDRSDGKEPLWIECGKSEITVSKIPRQGKNAGLAIEIKRFKGSDAMKQFSSWAARRDKGKVKFVILVRPLAAQNGNSLIQNLKSRGFSVGWDVWPKKRDLHNKQ